MIRIIAGEARGRVIATPEGQSTRPSSEKMREALFGSIQFDLLDTNVLDVFAGSGALALEALSRGAGSAVCNDNDRSSVECIIENSEMLGFSDRIQVKQMDYKDCLRQLADQGKCFDYIFIDPPYQSGIYEDVIQRIAAANLLAKEGSIFVEHSGEWECVPEKIQQHGLNLRRSKKYGKAVLERLVWA